MPIKRKSSLPGTRPRPRAIAARPRRHRLRHRAADDYFRQRRLAAARARRRPPKTRKPSGPRPMRRSGQRVPLAAVDLPPVLRLAGRGGARQPVAALRRRAGRGGTGRRCWRRLRPERRPPGAAADARADHRQRLDVQPARSGHAGGRRRDGVGRDVRRRGLDRGDPDRLARALRRRALRPQLPPRLCVGRERGQAGDRARSTTSARWRPAASST